MSFDNYCELEDDDCFAIIPYYLYEELNNYFGLIFRYILFFFEFKIF